jgi:processing peptidase subunit beta
MHSLKLTSRLASKSLRSFSTVPAVTPAAYKSLYSAPSTDVTTLKSGMRVASQTIHGETATVGVWIDAGSRYETAANNGVAHFLEHISFKGTQKRTQKQLEVEIENMGGHLNAYTSREQTVYYARVFKNDVPQAMEILSDILTNSLMDKEAIERERDVILREMVEVNKVYEEQILDHLHETAFMGTGLGHTILGPEENIKRLTRDDLLDYVQTHYTANRFVVAGAGAVDHNQLVDLTEKHFGKLPTAPKSGAQVVMDPAVFTGSDKLIRFDSMKEAHVALAFEGASWSSEFAFPMMVIQTLLGSWDRSSPAGNNIASRLARDIAENDAADSFMTFNTCYKDTGLFGVYLTAPAMCLEEAMYRTTYNITRLCHEVTDEEVARAKNQLKASVLVQQDNFSNICEDIGRQMLTYNRRMSNAEMAARIDAITTEDIKVTANRFFNDEDHALAAVGPIHELPDYNWIRRRSYWQRY